MIRDELRRALEVLGDRLPGGEAVVLVRRAFGDRGVSFARGDVEAVTGRPARVYEAPVEEWIEAVHPEDRETVRERLGELPDRNRLTLEYRVEQPDGGSRWIREELQVLRSAPQAPPEIVGLMTDVTIRRAARSRVARLESEVWRARKMESVGKVAAEVAHDFNNLLTVILGSADLLRHDRDLGEEAHDEARVIRESAIRGKDLVQRILTYASRTPSPGPTVDAARTVGELEEILARLVGPAVDLEVRLAADPWPLAADRAHLEQVVLNLVSNARDAMPGGGGLEVVLENRELDEPVDGQDGVLEPGRYVCLSVRDTGAGIAPEVRERLFEPFFTTKAEREGGGGFGLPTVLRIVRGYGGGIQIDTEPGRGTVFRVYFPTVEEAVLQPGELLPPGPEAVEEPEGGGLRVLVLEDDPAVRDVVERILSGEGHTVVTVASAGEALQVFDRVRPPFDLLISDVMLPDRSGPAVHRALARRVGELPVVFMSGYGRDVAIREGMVEADAVFLDKPFAPGELTRQVERMAERLREREEGDGADLPSTGEAGG